jgi:hypothetical protein
LTAPGFCRTEIEQRLKAISQQKDIDVALRTTSVPNIPHIAIASYFDNVFENDPAWRALSQPTSFARTFQSLGLGSAAPPDSVEFILLTDPKFVTMRVGGSTRTTALSYGLLSGSKLLQIQEFGTSEPAAAMIKLLDFFQTSFPDRGAEDWKMKTWRFIYADEISRIIESISLNHWSFYNQYLLRRSLQLQFAMSKIVWLWSAPLFGILLFLAIGKACVKITQTVFVLVGLPWLAFIVAIGVELATVFPAVGSLILISRQRLEDHLFVQSLLAADLTQLTPLISNSVLEFQGQTGFLWAIPLALVGVGYSVYVAFITDGGDKTIADQAGEDMLWSPVKYYFLFAYLPFAVSLIWAKKLFVDILFGAREVVRKANQ